MAPNCVPSYKEIVARRQEAVGELKAKGLTIREILVGLEEQGVVAPDGQPWTRSTIHRDLQHLLKVWREQAQAHIGEHVARQLAELTEAKREAWRQKDLTNWARLFALEMKLLGTDAPQKFEDWTDRDWREYASANGLTEAEVVAEAERLIAEAQSRRALSAPGGGAGSAPAAGEDELDTPAWPADGGLS